MSIMFSNENGVAQVLNKTGDKTVVDKVRYVFHATELTGEAYMDIHVNVFNVESIRVSASSIQDWTFLRASEWKLVEVAGGYTSNEYDIT